jgi:RimJ/RimL family protein N-acetyltransferase
MIQFDFNDDYILENERVLLRPIVLDDIVHLEAFSLNEAGLWKFNRGGAAGKENLENYISIAVAERKRKEHYRFIVFDKLNNEYTGSTGFYDIKLQNEVCEIGFTWYGKRFQGTGLNKHCKFLLLQFAFETIGFQRVGFKANNLNERSKNAMKSIGCIEEGVLRNFNSDSVGNRIDIIVLSILRKEWKKKVREMLFNKINS